MSSNQQEGEAASNTVDASLFYDVKKGDTLQGIALRRGLTVFRLKQLNKSVSGRVYEGQRLFLRENTSPAAHTEQHFRRFIFRFYNTHNPDKLSEVEGILSRWQGREKLLLVALHEKYDVPFEDDEENWLRGGIQPTQPNAQLEDKKEVAAASNGQLNDWRRKSVARHAQEQETREVTEQSQMLRELQKQKEEEKQRINQAAVVAATAAIIAADATAAAQAASYAAWEPLFHAANVAKEAAVSIAAKAVAAAVSASAVAHVAVASVCIGQSVASQNVKIGVVKGVGEEGGGQSMAAKQQEQEAEEEQEDLPLPNFLQIEKGERLQTQSQIIDTELLPNLQRNLPTKYRAHVSGSVSRWYASQTDCLGILALAGLGAALQHAYARYEYM
jgi:hypothetical protein